jgi:seryl-tRNA synthetase
MAFNFLGTLSKPQLDELRNFLEAEIEDVDQQINYLRTELNNLSRTRDDLLQADINFGGKTINTFVSDNEAVGTKKLTELDTQTNTVKSSEKNVTTKLPYVAFANLQDDSVSASLIEKAKRPFISNIKYKRERLEYKIKKITDAMEQTNETIDRKAIAKTQTAALLNQVDSMFNNTSNRGILFPSTEALVDYKRGKV